MSEKEFRPPPAPEREKESAPEPFLRRWARLKGDPAAHADERAPAPPPAEEDAAASEGDPAQAPPEQLPPTDEDMPPLESLDEHSDYSGFMSPRVSAALRKQALRKLFRSQKFNYICELDDYIDDYTSFPALGDIVTADMKHAAERLLKKQLEAEEADAAAAAAEEDAGAAPEAPGKEAMAGAHGAEQPGDARGATPDDTTDPSEDKQRDA